MSIPRVELSNGSTIPILGLGTWACWKDPESFHEAVKLAISTGYRHFDCAYIYKNEEYVGKALKEAIDANQIKRDDVFVTSKVWLTFFQKDNAVECCRRSLKKLGLDYLDLLLIHWPMRFKDDVDECYPVDADGAIVFAQGVDYLEAWQGLEKCVELGLVKSIGVSNFTVKQIERLLHVCSIKPVINQVECHPELNQSDLLDFCKKHGIVLTAFGPLGAPYKDTKDGPKPLLENEKVVEIATKLGKTAAQVLIRYQIDRGVVVIPKSVQPHRIVSNFQVFDFSLTPEMILELDSIDQKRHFATMLLPEGIKGCVADHPDFPFK